MEKYYEYKFYYSDKLIANMNIVESKIMHLQLCLPL